MTNNRLDVEYRSIVAGDVFHVEDWMDEPEDPTFAAGERVRTVRDIPTQHGTILRGTWLVVHAIWFDRRGERITLSDERMRIVVNDVDSECVTGF